MIQANNEWYEVGGTKQLPTGRLDLEFYGKDALMNFVWPTLNYLKGNDSYNPSKFVDMQA